MKKNLFYLFILAVAAFLVSCAPTDKKRNDGSGDPNPVNPTISGGKALVKSVKADFDCSAYDPTVLIAGNGTMNMEYVASGRLVSVKAEISYTDSSDLDYIFGTDLAGNMTFTY